MSQWTQNFVDELRRDKKKTVILSVLGVVGLIVGIRAIGGSSLPEPAAAMTTVGNGLNKAEMVSQAPAGDLAARDDARTRYIEQIDRNIQRDLFALNLSIFPMQEIEVAKPQVTTTKPVEVDAAEVERRTIEADAKSLSLLSTMVGPNSTAIVNNTVLRIGEKINGFEIVAITADSCLVQRHDVQVKLVMKRD